MAPPTGRLSIIDVGHGNAAIVESDGWIAVIDAGPGASLLQFLTERQISVIDEVLVSHADADHLGGLIGILASQEFTIKRVRLNSDAAKESKVWKDLVIALDDAARAGRIDFKPSLTESDSGSFDHGAIHIEILAPTNFLATKGPGGRDRRGRKITTNSISAAIRISVDGTRLALFAGDLDEIALDELTHVATTDLRAQILVYPHHGGKSGRNLEAFATQLCGMVRPSCIVFSIGRGLHQTPNPAIVSAIRATCGGVRIACTQLSEHCASLRPKADPTHLNPAFALGRERRQCCAGTLVVEFGDLATVLPALASHDEFITLNAPTALCRV